MKNLFPAALALIVALVLGYLAYYLADARHDDNSILVTVGTIISTALTLGTAMAVRPENERIGVNLRVLATMMFIATLACNLGFAAFGVAMPFYLVLIVLLLVVFLSVAWKLINIKDV